MPSSPAFVPGQVYAGFRLERAAALSNLRATAYQFEHLKSGARLLHVLAEDSENCFAVTFPTPPPDDTGLPHILEHSVLGGSHKFPVRDPFFAMKKMSLATFINAMTAPVFTVYPVASPVKKDFYNLAEVYLDAVFHPKLTENTFHREGHHLALADNNNLQSPLQIKGIVYSEMKGAYSQPEALAWILTRRLYPDTPLSRNAGGDPDRIPALTFAQFRQFHADDYHPSNALVFIYGDIPTVEHLRFLDPVLQSFDRRPVAISLPRQPRWTAPRRVEKDYPLGQSESAEARTYVTLNWLVGDSLDPALVTAWNVLDNILLGNEAAPLKKALIDSKLGTDIFMSGVANWTYEIEFHVGLKGSEPDRADAFEQLALESLAGIAEKEIDPKRVEAAFQQLTYEHLEINQLFPLHVLGAVNAAWPYGGDPLLFLRMDEHLQNCRRRYAADPRLFNRLIREGLLGNPHRLRILLRPDREAQSRADAAFARQMAERRAQFSADQIAAIARRAADLEAEQARPEPAAALATLPQLKISDLPAQPRHIPTEISRVAGVEVLRNDVFANGVNYLQLDVDLGGLPHELYPYLPRYTAAFNKLGAAGQSYAQIAARRAACTGGLSCGFNSYRHAVEPARTLCRLRFGLKTLDGQAAQAWQLLEDLFFGLDPRDPDRLHTTLQQAVTAYQTSLVQNGAVTARRQAGRGLSPEAALDHLFMSPQALHFTEDLARNFAARAEPLMNKIETIRDFLQNRRRWTISFTGSDSVFAGLTRRLADWSARLRDEPVPEAAPPFTPLAAPPREGLAAPMKIAHCARVMPALPLAHPDAPLFQLGAHLLTFEYCLPIIRLKGNAYGAWAQYNEIQCVFQTLSFFDPHLVETLAVFDGVRNFVQAAPWTQTDIDRAIIGSLTEAEAPIRPAPATDLALRRHIRGETRERREQRYAAALRATPREVKRVLLEQLELNEPRAGVCVVASREKLAEANQALGDRPLAITDILS